MGNFFAGVLVGMGLVLAAKIQVERISSVDIKATPEAGSDVAMFDQFYDFFNGMDEWAGDDDGS
jgi:hypothetical protein